jgi:hypothetical protein
MGAWNRAYRETQTTSTIPQRTTTTTTTYPSGCGYPCSSQSVPTLSWSAWNSRATLAIENGAVDVSSCVSSGTNGDIQALYDAGNSAPDPSQTIADDMIQLGTTLESLQGAPNSCTGFGGVQSTWQLQIKQLNSNLQSLGQPQIQTQLW